MRLTGGILKGRKLFFRKTPSLRPTRNIVREAIFDILREDIQGSRVLEIFAGTGSLGFEALSRGALSVVFVDNYPQSIRILKRNCRLLNLENKTTIIKMDTEKALKKFCKSGQIFDVVLADPPYNIETTKMRRIFLQVSTILNEDGFFVVELSSKRNVFESPENSSLELNKERKYGSTRIQIYKKKRTPRSLSG
ncbi:MAG: 16S rRNA (guanine(966)-N(2))-methyltransferase RsmD [bacterium]|nr:16S rRNA (guanine(966)-N(2))-methyltransferase RsmD [bacterium]